MAEPDIDQEDVQRVRGGHYTGPEAHVIAPWKCPACGVEQVGRVELGCPSCGSGKPGVHVGVQQAARPTLATRADAVVEREDLVTTSFYDWLREQPTAGWHVTENEMILLAAFRAGWRAAQGRTVQAPPVTADLTRLSPEGKSYRTIIAALEMFVDGVLRGNPEEILSGEWCSIEEAKALIEQLRPGAES